MEEQLEKDIIRDLPLNIQDLILEKIPIDHVIRTSRLSKYWRYKWASRTRLDFDDRGMATLYGPRQSEIVVFITKMLLLHDGTIHRFCLSNYWLETCQDIQHWLIHVSRKDPRELVVRSNMHRFMIPSCVFGCQSLTLLDLTRCDLPCVNPDFKGFPSLKHLNLDRIEIRGSPDIQGLINCCRVLESLTIVYNDVDAEVGRVLTVPAHMLKYVSVKGSFTHFRFTSNPRLVHLYVDMESAQKEYDCCIIDNFLVDIPNLERLIGHNAFMKYLCMGRGMQGCLQEKCGQMKSEHLKVIELHNVEVGLCDEVDQIRCLLDLVAKCPNLEELHVYFETYREESRYLILQHESIYTFPKLRVLKLFDMYGYHADWKFAQVLVTRSCILANMVVTPSTSLTGEETLALMFELSSFLKNKPRLSIKYDGYFLTPLDTE